MEILQSAIFRLPKIFLQHRNAFEVHQTFFSRACESTIDHHVQNPSRGKDDSKDAFKRVVFRSFQMKINFFSLQTKSIKSIHKKKANKTTHLPRIETQNTASQ